MNIYMIYAPFLLLCVFCLCLSVFADFIFTSSSMCNWKMLKGLEDQAKLQRRLKVTQHRQNSLPKSKHQKKTKRNEAEEIRTGPDRPHHGLPCGPPRPLVGGARSCVRGGTAVRPSVVWVFPFFFVPLRFLRVFSGFAL